MAAILKVTRADGSVSEYKITPGVKYAFEKVRNKGWIEAWGEKQLQGDLYWLAWECQRRNGETVPLSLDEYVNTLEDVEAVLAPNA